MAEKNFTKKRYVKSGTKTKDFGDGGEIINLDLNLADLSSLPVNAGGYVKICLAKLRTPDKFGNSHAVYENDFVPDKSKGAGKAYTPATQGRASYKKNDDSALPF
jgi:hypothetical protein